MKKQSFLTRLKTASRFLFSQGYDASQSSRLRGARRNVTVRPEETELDAGDRERVIATLLDFRRNNPIVRSICRLRETDVVGAGLFPRLKSGSDALDAELEYKWEEYSENPELSWSMNMRQVQQQLVSLPLIFGDGGLFLHKSGMVQLVEGDRIGVEGGGLASIFPNDPRTERFPNKENLVEGIEVNTEGRPLAYHIGRRAEDGSLVDTRRVMGRNFIFYRKRIRPTQIRGVPELATVCNDLQDIEEYDTIEIVAAKVTASLAAVVKREGSTDFELSASSAGDDQSERLESIEPGRFHYLEPDEDVSVVGSGGRPNSGAIEYLTYRLRKIGASVGIPYEFLLMTIGDSSFSSSQGMVLLYQATVESEQRNLMPLLSRWWRWRVGKWIRDGEVEVPAGADPFRISWQPPSFRWINRAAQVKADASYLAMGALSLDDVAATFGSQANEVLEKKAKNIEVARKLAEQYGIGDWRDLFNPLTTFASVNLLELMNQEKGETEP